MEVASFPLKRLADIMYYQLQGADKLDVDALLHKASRTVPAEWETLGIEPIKKFPGRYLGTAGENFVIFEIPPGERPVIRDIFRRELVEHLINPKT
jgi:hypothetical protein